MGFIRHSSGDSPRPTRPTRPRAPQAGVRAPFGSWTRPARGVSVLCVLGILWTSGVVAGPGPQDVGRGAADALDDETVECPRCGGTGKMECSECGGRGEIYRVCEICKGTGRKPCPVCTKPDPAGGQATPPGTVRCGYCAGRGTTGPTGRTCPKCQGTGLLVCPTCIGSGTVSCRKEVFVRVCPRCRFTGKETCSLCGGTGRVSRSVAMGKEDPAVPADSESGRPRDSSEESAEAVAATRVGASGDDGPSFAEIKARYDALAPHCEMHYDVFAEDLSPKAEAVRVKARDWARKLELAGAPPDSETLHDLQMLVERAESFRKRWQDLRGMLQEEHRSYTSAKRTLELREEAVSRAKGSSRDRLEEHWNDRFDLVVRILEKNAAPLLEDDPTWLSREIESIESSWDQLEPRVEKEAVLLAELRAKPAEPGSEPAATTGSGTPSDKTSEASSAGGSATSPPSPLSTSPELARVARDVADTGDSRRAVVESTDPVSEAIARAPHSDGRPTSREPAARSPGESGSGILWAIVGFLSATALFAAGSRLRRRGTRDEDSSTRDSRF